MTLAGTNTYVVATPDGAFVIDPGPDDDLHLSAIRAAAAPRGGIAGVLLTHGHSDHTAAVASLGEPVLWGAAMPDDEAAAMAALFADPAAPIEPATAPPPAATSTAGPFEVVPTPGHATDHVCFVRGGVCFCGDLILGQGSSIVPPSAGGGSLTAYMDSLRRVGDLGAGLLAPGHGPWITDPAAKVSEYIEHRESRERALLAALDSGERSRERLLEIVWSDVPDVLRPAAAVAMQAHLEKLAAEGRLPDTVPGA